MTARGCQMAACDAGKALFASRVSEQSFYDVAMKLYLHLETVHVNKVVMTQLPSGGTASESFDSYPGDLLTSKRTSVCCRLILNALPPYQRCGRVSVHLPRGIQADHWVLVSLRQAAIKLQVVYCTLVLLESGQVRVGIRALFSLSSFAMCLASS